MEYALALAALGQRVTVACPSGAANPGWPPLLEVLPVNITIRGKKNPIPSTILAYRLKSVLTRRLAEIDVLHMPSFPEFGLYLGPLLRLPSVLHVTSLPVSSVAALRLGRWAVRLQRRLFTLTVTVGPELSDDLFGRPGPEVPIGVNLDRFRPGRNEPLRNRLGLGPSDVLGVYTGAMGRVRNLPALLEAAGRVKPRGGVSLKLLLVGGTAEEVATLRAVAERLGVANRVLVEEYVPFERIPGYLQAADFALAYVPLRPQYENQPPLKTLEYLATGLPTIATDTAGNRRFVRDGFNGLLTSDAPEDLARALLRVAAEPDLRGRLSRNARSSVTPYDYRTVVEGALLPVYREAVDAYGRKEGRA